jgi:WD40 repeat protein
LHFIYYFSLLKRHVRGWKHTSNGWVIAS